MISGHQFLFYIPQEWWCNFNQNLFSFDSHSTGGDGGGEQGPDGGAVKVVPGPKNVVTLKTLEIDNKLHHGRVH